jgi:hypothetical protein
VEGLSGIGATEVVFEVAVSGEELFGTRVIRLEVCVRERPRRGDAAFVMEDAEVLGAKAKQCGAVDLGLAADEVGLLGVKGLIIFVEPDIFGVITVVEEDGGSVPVEFFLREKRAAFEDENALPCLREVEGESATAGSGSDDDDVVLIGHGVLDKDQEVNWDESRNPLVSGKTNLTGLDGIFIDTR